MTDYKEYVYAVYREKSFSRAAQSLFVSQPWLSSAVKKVEQELETPLFDRSTTPISLTPAGEYYIEQIERIMAIEEEMRLHFRQLREAEAAELHIGSSMFFCTYVLPILMGDFQAMYPQVTLTYSEGGSMNLTEKLLRGELDFLLEAEKPDSDRLHTIPWASEELILAVPADAPINEGLRKKSFGFEQLRGRGAALSSIPPVALNAFRNESFLLLKEGNDSHERINQMCKNAGFTPGSAMYLTQMMTAYYLVCEGRGITFLRSTIPEHVTPTDRVVFYRIDDPLAVRNIYLSYPKKHSSPVRRHLIDFMLDKRLLRAPIPEP